MGKIVVCNGGYKTGSTLAFNIALKIIQYKKVVFNKISALSWQISNMVAEKNNGLWILIKSHDFMPNQEDDHLRIIHTYRNPLSVAASCLNYPNKSACPTCGTPTEKAAPACPMCEASTVLGDESMLRFLQYQKAMKYYHESRGDTIVFAYIDLYENLNRCIEEMAEFLELPLSSEELEAVSKELSLESVEEKCKDINGADALTEFRPDTISKWRGDPEGSELFPQNL